MFTDSNNLLHIRVHTLGYVHFVFTYCNNPVQVLLSLKRHSTIRKIRPLPVCLITMKQFQIPYVHTGAATSLPTR